MAYLLLIAFAVGARGASGLASVGDLELMQMGRGVSSMSRVERGRDSFTYAGVPIYPHTVHLDDLEDDVAPLPWILELVSDATDDELQHLIREYHDGQMSHPDQGELPMVVVSMTSRELMALLDKHPGRFQLVEEDVYETMINETIDADDSQWRTIDERRTYPWGIQSINADLVRGRGVDVHVYVLDTGIRITHTEFGGRAFAGVDVATTGNLTVCDPCDTTCAGDGHGHGTHCAGTVGASTYGVADGATIWAMKVLRDDGNGFTSWINLAEQWVLSSGMRPAVVSLSLGGPGQMQSHKDSIDSLVADGVVVVVAAGNANSDACNFRPAYIPSAITVGSYKSNSAMSGFSNYGSCIDVWAPGSGVLSLSRHSDTATATSSGTSMACPHVSGLAAIMFEACPSAGSMNASERWDLLAATNRTGSVTGIPTTPASVNLVIEAPTVTPPLPASCSSAFTPSPSPQCWIPTSSPTPSPTPSPTTPSPTPAPTPSPTPSPTPAPAPTPAPPRVSATGDPHLTNMYGERFDLYHTGVHVLLQIPRLAGPQQTLLRLEANATRMGACSELYFQALVISGIWTNRSDKIEFLAKSDDKPSSMKWTRFGKVGLKVVNGRTQQGLDYLNVFARDIGTVGYSVGGLLGEDDHKDVSIPPKACAKILSLIERPGSLVASAVVAGFA